MRVPWPCARRDQSIPFTARLTASVPPPVKVTSIGSTPRVAAMRARDSSSRARADWPEEWIDDGLPTTSSASTYRSRTARGMGEVAAWSR